MNSNFLSKNFLSPSSEELDAFLVISHDPSAVATKGAIGQLVLNKNTGIVYRKTDNGTSTNWEEVNFSGGGSSAFNDSEINFFTDMVRIGFGVAAPPHFIDNGYSYYAQQGHNPSSVIGDEKVVGSLRIRTNTTGVVFERTASIDMRPGVVTFLNNELRIKTKIKFGTLGTVGESFAVKVGFVTNQNAAQPNLNGAFFRFQSGVNSNKWELVSCNSGNTEPTGEVIDSGVEPVVVDYEILEVAIRAGVVEYFINNLKVGEATNILPDSAQTIFSFVGISKVAGVADNFLNIDYINTNIKFLNGRI